MFTNRLRHLFAVIAILMVTACTSQVQIGPTPSPQTVLKPTLTSTIAVQSTETVPAIPLPAATPKLGELLGCVPGCVSGIVKPGNLRAGKYQTQYFFGGRMQVTLNGNWSSNEDSTGEFDLSPSGSNDAIFFFEDVYPLENISRVQGVPMTAAGLLNWLSKTPRLKTTSPVTGYIGGTIPATIVDVSIAPGAQNEDPTCVTDHITCILFLGFPQWDDQWGIAGSQIQRFYIADVSYGGASHVFVAVIYPDDPANMDSFRAVAEPLIASVRVPVDQQ